MTTADRFDFPNAQGRTLGAVLQRPVGTPTAYALFAHCFTCSKDSRAARGIAEALAAAGIAVLRFDFTGLGSSEGDFANADFSSNIDDLVAAADHLRATEQAPALLIGHSLGGSAVLAAASRIPESTAVVTIGAPADPGHVTHFFGDAIDTIRANGEGEVSLGGRVFRIRSDLLDDVAEHNLLEQVASLQRALLILHAPTDEVVSIDNAAQIFSAARHPRSFISLDDADHMLGRRRDAQYAADVIAAWAQRYLPESRPSAAERAHGEVLVEETGDGTFQQLITIGDHQLLADEPVDLGGGDTGPSPYDLLLAGLGACTAMTLRLYAGRKGLALDPVRVALRHAKIHAMDCQTCETKQGQIDRIERVITVTGDIDDAQRARLLEIADKCPVHRTLTSEISIQSRLAP